MAVTVLLTGAAGVLGNRIRQRLNSAGYHVVSCGRRPSPGIDVVWDIARDDAPPDDMAADVVIHAAACKGKYGQSIVDSPPCEQVNITGTWRVARWCVARHVKQLVLVSGALVYGRWTSSPYAEDAPVRPWLAGPYAVSKYGSELAASLVHETGCQLSILRLASLYGAGYSQGLVQRLLSEGLAQGQIRIASPWEDAFDLLHVEDAARTVCQSLEQARTGMWNVGGQLVTLRKLANVCGEQAGCPVLLDHAASPRPARILNWVDDRRARQQLGHANRVSLPDGVSEAYESLLSRTRRVGREAEQTDLV